MTPEEKQLILSFAKNDMSITNTAKSLFRSKTSILYQLGKIKSKYGLDPRRFHDLTALISRVQHTDDGCGLRRV